MNFLKVVIILFIVSAHALFAGEIESYVNQELNKLDDFLEKYDFIEGEVYFNEDTIKADILNFKRKDKRNTYIFCVIKTADDSIKTYAAKQILGYKVQEEVYVKHVVNSEHFFINEIISGKVYLYKRPPIPSDSRFLYYLKKDNNPFLYTINPNANNIKTYKLPNPHGGSANSTENYYEDQGINRKFEEFISVYMWDCLSIKNKVLTRFYTIDDIVSIVNSYNRCFPQDIKGN